MWRGQAVRSSVSSIVSCGVASVMPVIPAVRPAVEDRDVLGQRDLPRGLREVVEVGVLGAAGDVVELGARDA